MVKRISTSIDEQDAQYISENNLMVSRLIRGAIDEHKAQYGAGEESFRELNRKLASWTALAQKLRAFIEQEGLLDKWLKSEGA